MRLAGRLAAAAVALAAVLLLAGAGGARAWGPDGHRATALLAQSRLSVEAEAGVRALLGNDSLASVASWADEQRNNPAWAWSTPLHYANTPYFACDFVMARDCPGGRCVVGAVANYTQRLGDASLPLLQRQQALYMVVHLLGDIHQPLHVSFKVDHGGNLLEGTFFGAKTNLHSVWDEDAILRRMKDDFGSDLVRFGAYLAGLMAGKGPYARLAAPGGEWVACDSVANKRCLLGWANESARLTCSRCETDAGGRHVANGFALGAPYYARAMPVIEQRLCTGGARLAAVLNRVFAPQP